MPSEQQVLDAMRHIIDPDLGRDIISLGFIKDLKIEGGRVSFTVELTTPACPIKERFRTQCEAAVRAVEGVESVDVRMTAMTPHRQPGEDINTLDGVETIIAVSSCKGGVGKSTVAAQLARAMQRQGLGVGLLDADVHGPSVPTMFNLHHPQLYVQDNKLLPVDVDGLKVMSLGFLLGDSPAVLRGPIVSGYIQQILKQTEWGKLDYLIIDMPPGTGDVQLTIVQQAALDGAIIVTTPQALALVDVARGILMFEKVNVPVLGLVENMSHFVCDGCGKKHHIFGPATQTLQDRFGITLLADLPIIHGVSNLDTATAAELPEFVRLAENVHREIGKRRLERPAPPVVTPEPGVLHIQWPDGTESTIPNLTVRGACPCAQCVDEMTGRPVLDIATIPDDLRIEGIDLLGNYAVSIAWSDGHSTGIFSWALLRGLAAANAATNAGPIS